MHSYLYRDFQSDSERLYNHLLDLKTLNPEEAIQLFRYLFIDGVTYPDFEVLSALHRIVRSQWAEQEFKFILNRCCYILVNHWWSHTASVRATLDLVNLLQHTSSESATLASTQQLRWLVQQFTQTDLYRVLRERAQAVAPDPATQWDTRSQTLREFLPRYPYLYPHFWASMDSSEIGQQVLRQLQEKKEQQFERSLSNYSVGLLRRNRSDRADLPAVTHNPTLLTDEQLQRTLREFAGKVDGSNTYRDLARRFVLCSEQASSYREVKRQMQDYLMAAVRRSSQGKYADHYFKHWLSERLDNMLPQYEAQKPTDTLLVQTCGQLITALVAAPNPNQSMEYLPFEDLTANLDSTFSTGLLLKILLVCQRVRSNMEALKAHLSKRLADVLRYYETRVSGEVQWLVDSLEKLMIGFSVHSGRSDFSWVSLL